MLLLRGPVHTSGQSFEPAMEHAVAQALLRRASRGEINAALRVYRPDRDVVAFGRRDLRRPRFDEAVAACRSAGFASVVRPAGGRAVACTPQCLVLDHVSHDPLSPGGMEERFADFGALFVDVLNGLGIDARVGEVPGEYCPGSQSVNARGEVKLVGTAQRMVRRAWLFSSVVVFDGVSRVRPVLAAVYDALELPFAPASVGSVHEERPASTMAQLEEAVLSAYSSRFALEPAELDARTLGEAQELLADHRVG